MTHPKDDVVPRVHVRGIVSRDIREYAIGKVAAAVRYAPAPVLDTRLTLDTDAPGPRVDANVVVNGVAVHVHAIGETMREAIDLIEARLRARLDHLRRRPAQGPPPPREADAVG